MLCPCLEQRPEVSTFFFVNPSVSSEAPVFQPLPDSEFQIFLSSIETCDLLSSAKPRSGPGDKLYVLRDAPVLLTSGRNIHKNNFQQELPRHTCRYHLELRNLFLADVSCRRVSFTLPQTLIGRTAKTSSHLCVEDEAIHGHVQLQLERRLHIQR